MNGFLAVFKREFKGYFSTPLAYVFLVIFLFAAGYKMFSDGFYQMRQADMRTFFSNLPLLFVIMVPATAMRLWAEERKSGSIELLLTLPITVTQAVLGKFFAAWLFLAVALLLTIPVPITVCYLGEPDIGMIITGYIGSLFLAGGFLAIGSFFSAVTKNQVICLVLSAVVCGIFIIADMPTTQAFLSRFLMPGMVKAISQLSFQGRFDSIQRGVIQFKDMAYFILTIAGWVWANIIILDERKAS